jgi:TM2 domain-containing membrane protein YozV
MANGEESSGRPAASSAPPQHPLDGRYYVRGEAGAIGPYEGQAIKEMIEQGKLSATTGIARVGDTQWSELKHHPYFGTLSPAGSFVPPPGSYSSGVSSDARAMMMFQANQKSLLVSYLFWFFLGGLSVHRFYNGRIGSGVVQILMLIFGFVLITAGGFMLAVAHGGWIAMPIGALMLVFVGLWWLVDAFLIPGWVREQNNLLAMQLSNK